MLKTAVREISRTGLSSWYNNMQIQRRNTANVWCKTKQHSLFWEQSKTALHFHEIYVHNNVFLSLTCCTSSTAYGQGLCLNRILQVNVIIIIVEAHGNNYDNLCQLPLELHACTTLNNAHSCTLTRETSMSFCNCCFSWLTSRASSVSKTGPCKLADLHLRTFCTCMLAFFLLVSD